MFKLIALVLAVVVTWLATVAAAGWDPQVVAAGAVAVLGTVAAPFVLAKVPLHDWRMRWAALALSAVIATVTLAIHGDLNSLDWTDPFKIAVPALAIARLVSYVYELLKTRYSL